MNIVMGKTRLMQTDGRLWVEKSTDSQKTRPWARDFPPRRDANPVGSDKARASRDKRRYIQVFHDMVDSPAWRGLSHPARTLLTLFQRQFNGYNKDEIILPQSKAVDYMTARTFRRARAELIAVGFVEIKKRGGRMGNPHVYKLSDTWRASYGQGWKK